jgi:hypothetical protein
MTFVASPVLSVLELFKGPLAGMHFADVNAEGLALLAANVERAGAEVASAEAKLAELRQALATEQDALLALTQRALAYARVYAENHDELMASLDGIALPRPTKPRKASSSKPSPAEAPARGPVAAPLEPADAQAAPAPIAEATEAREVELDSERNEAEAAPSPAGRKSRRNRLAAAEAQTSVTEGAGASE